MRLVEAGGEEEGSVSFDGGFDGSGGESADAAVAGLFFGVVQRRPIRRAEADGVGVAPLDGVGLLAGGLHILGHVPAGGIVAAFVEDFAVADGAIAMLA